MAKTRLSARNKDVDKIALPDWDSFPIEEHIARHQINGANMGRSMPLLAMRGRPFQCTFCEATAILGEGHIRWLGRLKELRIGLRLSNKLFALCVREDRG